MHKPSTSIIVYVQGALDFDSMLAPSIAQELQACMGYDEAEIQYRGEVLDKHASTPVGMKFTRLGYGRAAEGNGLPFSGGELIALARITTAWVQRETGHRVEPATPCHSVKGPEICLGLAEPLVPTFPVNPVGVDTGADILAYVETLLEANVLAKAEAAHTQDYAIAYHHDSRVTALQAILSAFNAKKA